MVQIAYNATTEMQASGALFVWRCESVPTFNTCAPTRPIVTDFYRFCGLSWETSPQENLTPEASEHSGSRRIEFSSKSTTFLM